MEKDGAPIGAPDAPQMETRLGGLEPWRLAGTTVLEAGRLAGPTGPCQNRFSRKPWGGPEATYRKPRRNPEGSKTEPEVLRASAVAALHRSMSVPDTKRGHQTCRAECAYSGSAWVGSQETRGSTKQLLKP